MNVEYITTTITTHADKSMYPDVAVVPEQQFNSFAERDQFPDRYGWTFPGDALIFCPEIIAAQTTQLSDDELGKYLHAILWMCDRHLTLKRTVPDDGARHRMIEDELLTLAPGSLDIMSRVEIHALDHNL